MTPFFCSHQLISLFSFRTDITASWEWTPLHYACERNKDEIALCLIKEERERVISTQEDAQPGRKRRRGQQDTPSYNMRDINGYSPVFWTSSLTILEEMLKLDDLYVTDGIGRPLLWHCAERGYVSERVASDQKLAGQYGQRWRGSLPLEEGEHEH